MLVKFSKTGRNSKFVHRATSLCRELMPKGFYRRRLRRALAELDGREDKEYILSRVDYYCKLDRPAPLPADAPRIGDLRLKEERSAYYFDAEEYLSWFDGGLRWNYLFGDITHVPPHPAVLKSRPVAGDNRNSVLLNLDKARHFTFVEDSRAFSDKHHMSVFRGKISGKPPRIRFMEMYYGSAVCDAGIVPDGGDFPPEWTGRRMTFAEHLENRFILALEGNDVATNLKWVMSSNSLAVMPRPTYETWFMEGTLVPGVHYVEIRSDFSDLAERMEYYSQNPAEAETIIRNAHQYIDQFRDPRRERLISLLVLEKYFRMTGQ